MMSGVQQMLRVDWEDVRPLDGAAHEAALSIIPGMLEDADAVVLSDYGKGMLTEEILETTIAAGRARGIPVLVDPKGSDFSRYRGATLVTPNRKEAELALGRKIETLEDLPAAADELMRVAELDMTLITLSADGIYFRAKASGISPRRRGGSRPSRGRCST